MKKVKAETVLAHSHQLINSTVTGTASLLKDADLIIRLDDLMKERGLTQRDLAKMSGLRIGTISDTMNGKLTSINLVQVLALMSALQLTELAQLFEVRLPLELADAAQAASVEWIATKDVPIDVRERLATVNKKKERGN